MISIAFCCINRSMDFVHYVFILFCIRLEFCTCKIYYHLNQFPTDLTFAFSALSLRMLIWC
jgi:hypothetical protein